MITLNLTFQDLKQMRFAFSLLTEVVLSYRALWTPSLYTTYAPWIENTREQLRGVNLDYMRALISPQGLVPDFLIPLPAIGMPSLSEELHRLTLTPGDTVCAQIGVIPRDWNPAPHIRQHFIDDPAGALAKLADTVDRYWQRALAPHWSRIFASLEKDLLFCGGGRSCPKAVRLSSAVCSMRSVARASGDRHGPESVIGIFRNR